MTLHDEANAREYVRGLAGGDAMDRLEKLAVLLREESERQNLVAKVTLEQVWVRHIADSAQLIGLVPRETGIWLDLGTGAGFPGVVVAALLPKTRVLLVESRRKRVDWLGRLIAQLKLSNCEVIGRRCETVRPFPANVISARAFAPLDKLIALASPFSTSDTAWVLPKGKSAAHELAGIPKAWQKMFHVERSLTDANAGIIVGAGQPLVKEAGT